MAVTCIRSTGGNVPTTAIGPSTSGNGYIHLKYMLSRSEIEQ
eukprot:CAMPEP_0174378332 /NCGR_PEP_ID=MMETSP0811_2-20130205/121984_1 /TAXON_ID=73025 ORGANISM="Eutreptiella gymnastica-like, Strain CCMP1594" /NCGR_SAMPLE_ID=MMETSP0811_2 /ASSEMBLY_ACC=CAM_ASM_000667 /LENGTH=41 /DNA_ID= /DNA_START= /DNA_END= /DNA_ORIENTATION=